MEYLGIDSRSMGVVLSLVLGGPVVGGLIAGVVTIVAAKKTKQQAPPLLKPFTDYFFLLRQIPLQTGVAGEVEAFLQLAFSLLTVAMFGLQMNLLLIFFFQAFALMTVLVMSMNCPVDAYQPGINQKMKPFLLWQPVLLGTAAGIGLLTGGFSVADIFAHPRLLIWELPFLWVALLAVFVANDRLIWLAGLSGLQLAVLKLAACFRQITLLLLAGAFLTNTLLGAVVASLLIYVAACFANQFRLNSEWSVKAERSYGLIWVACVANLSWLYIKYWL